MSAITSENVGLITENTITSSEMPISMPTADMTNDLCSIIQDVKFVEDGIVGCQEMEELETMESTLPSFVYSTTSAVGTNLYPSNLEAVISTKNFGRLLSKYKYMSFDLCYTFNVPAAEFATGAFIICSVAKHPNNLEPSLTNPIVTLQAASMADNAVLVDVSRGGVFSIIVPFTPDRLFTRNFNGTKSIDSWFVTYVIPLVSYSSPPGANSSIDIIPTVKVINFKSYDRPILSSQALFSFGEKHVTNITMSNLRDATLPMNAYGDALTVAPHLSGFDSASYTSNPPSMLSRIFQKFWYTKNVVDTLKMENDASPLVLFTKKEKKLLRIKADPMTINYLKNRFVHVSTSSIATSTTSGSVLYSSLVTCFPVIASPVNDNFTNTLPPNVSVTPLHIATHAISWRGSIKYRFKVIGNKYLKAKLLIAFLPGEFTAPTSSFGTGQMDPRSVTNIIYDTSVDEFVDFEIPFTSHLNALYTGFSDAVVPFKNPVSNNLYSMGTIAVYLQTRIITSNNASSSLSLSVFYAWGDDFKLFNSSVKSGNYLSQVAVTRCEATPPQLFSSCFAEVRSIKDLLLIPRRIKVGSVIGAANKLNYYYTPISPLVLASDAIWNYVRTNFLDYVGGFRVIITNIGTTPLMAIKTPGTRAMTPDKISDILGALSSSLSGFDYKDNNGTTKTVANSNNTYNGSLYSPFTTVLFPNTETVLEYPYVYHHAWYTSFSVNDDNDTGSCGLIITNADPSSTATCTFIVSLAPTDDFRALHHSFTSNVWKPGFHSAGVTTTSPAYVGTQYYPSPYS